MPCRYGWAQINAIDRAISALTPFPDLRGLPIYSELFAMRNRILGQLIGPFPRTTLQVLALLGLSPGSVRVWFDVERGWMAEGRKSPRAVPTYHYIREDQALALLRKPPDAELAHKLMEADPYVGE